MSFGKLNSVVGLVTFLLLFGLMLAGGIIGISGLLKCFRGLF